MLKGLVCGGFKLTSRDSRCDFLLFFCRVVVRSSCLYFGEQIGVKIVKKFPTLFDFSW